MNTEHVVTERLAAFLDHQLSPAAQEEVVAHFAECATCRREMTAMRQLLKGREKRTPWYVVTPMLLALAASIAFLMVPPASRVDSGSPSSIRSGTITSIEQITMVTPADDAVLETYEQSPERPGGDASNEPATPDGPMPDPERLTPD